MILRILFVFSCFAASLHAQEDSTRKVKLRVAALGIVGAYDTLWVGNGAGKEPTSLRLNTRTFSPATEVRVAGGNLAFYLERKKAEAAEPPAPAVTVPLQKDSGLVIFLPDKDRYRAIAVPDGEIAAESFVLFNLSAQSVAWSFDGGKAEVVSPGGRAVRHVTAGSGSEVKIVMKQPDGSQKLIRNTVWQMNAGQREFVFVHGTPESPAFHHLIASEPLAPAQ